MDGRDFQRWASVAAGAVLAAAGLKRGGRTGALMSLAGGALSAGAYMKLGKQQSVFTTPARPEWELPRERLVEDARVFSRTGRVGQQASGADDEVVEASDESFPASDAPSFTPTTSLGRHERS